MLSRFIKGHPWYDVAFLIFLVIVVSALIQQLIPNTGLAHAIHQGFHLFAIVLQWVAGGLLALANILNSL